VANAGTAQPWFTPAGVNRGAIPLDRHISDKRYTVANIAQYDYRFQWEIPNRSTCPYWIANEIDSVCAGKWTWRRYSKVGAAVWMEIPTPRLQFNSVVLSFDLETDLASAKMIVPHDFEMTNELLMSNYRWQPTLKLASAAIHRLRNDTCKVHK